MYTAQGRAKAALSNESAAELSDNRTYVRRGASLFTGTFDSTR